MNGTELSAVLTTAFARLANASDELRELDAAVGDGDLGITITKGADAVGIRMSELAHDVLPSDVILATADAFGTANPSTFASLVSSGLAAGAKTTSGLADLSTLEFVALGKAAAATIMRRGKSSVGDKTLLDALVPSLEAAELHTDDGAGALQAAIAAAVAGIAGVTGIAANKGRALWAGERGIGIPDAGATAYLRFLEALSHSVAVINDRRGESMTTRVFTFYRLNEGVDLEEFMEWSRRVDQPTCRLMDACRSFEVFLVRGEARGQGFYDVVEDIEVVSWQAWQDTLASPAFAQVSQEWPTYGDESSLLSIHCEKI